MFVPLRWHRLVEYIGGKPRLWGKVVITHERMGVSQFIAPSLRLCSPSLQLLIDLSPLWTAMFSLFRKCATKCSSQFIHIVNASLNHFNEKIGPRRVPPSAQYWTLKVATKDSSSRIQWQNTAGGLVVLWLAWWTDK